MTNREHPFRVGTLITKKGRSMSVIVNEEKWWGAKLVGYTKNWKQWIEKGWVSEVINLNRYERQRNTKESYRESC